MSADSPHALPFVPFAAEGASWEWRGDRLHGTRREVALLATPEVVGNRHVTVGLVRFADGMAAPWHVHEDWEEFVYVLEGQGEFLCDSLPAVPIGPGSVNVIPPGAWHTHRARGGTLQCLWGYSPPGVQLTT